MKHTLKDIWDWFCVVVILSLAGVGIYVGVYFEYLKFKNIVENWDTAKESAIKTPEYMQAETINELKKQNEELRRLTEKLLEQKDKENNQ